LTVDVAVFERDPLARAKPGRGREQHEWPVLRAEQGRERVEVIPGLERPFLRPPELRIVDALLGWVHINHPPRHRPSENLAERLGRLEPVPGWDRHPPRRDRRRLELVDPPVPEDLHRLAE